MHMKTHLFPFIFAIHLSTPFLPPKTMELLPNPRPISHTTDVTFDQKRILFFWLPSSPCRCLHDPVRKKKKKKLKNSFFPTSIFIILWGMLCFITFGVTTTQNFHHLGISANRFSSYRWELEKFLIIEMSSGRIKVCWVAYISSLSILVLGISPCGLCVDGDDYSQTGNPALVPLVTNHIYDQVSNLTVVFHDDIKTELGYCIKDVWVINKPFCSCA